MSSRIQLLGAFGLYRGDEPVPLPARKTEALLALLALRPGVALGREQLCALLWPDVPDAQARTSLRQALGHLRRALPEGALATGADQLHLVPGLVWVDTAEVEQVLARPPCEREQLPSLWRGELMAGFPAVSDAFASWLDDERARALTRLLPRVEECVAALSAAGHAVRACALAEWLVELEPTRESSQRALMRLYAERGDRASALRAFERCRSVLAQRLAIEPSEETLRLRAELAAAGSGLEPAPESRGRAPSRWALAILPLSASPDTGATQLLADALTEDVTTELGRFPELALLSRDAVAALVARGASLDLIARELGARVVLSGTVRGAGDRARVSAALTDTTTRLELWSQKWEVQCDDVFGALERLTRSVAAALALRIEDTRLERARRRPFERLEAYECWLRGMDCLRRGNPQEDEAARGFFERALELAPDFARAHAGISLSHFNDWSCQAWERWELRERLAFESARRAVTLDDSDPVSQLILGRIQLYRREFDLAEHHLERAVTLNPNDAMVLLHAANGFALLGKAPYALSLLEAAFWLNPTQPDWAYTIAGGARLLADEPAAAAQLMLRAPDSLVDTRAQLAIACYQAGDVAQARLHAARFVEHFSRKIARGAPVAPGDPARWFFHVNPLRRPEDEQRLQSALTSLGLGA